MDDSSATTTAKTAASETVGETVATAAAETAGAAATAETCSNSSRNHTAVKLSFLRQFQKRVPSSYTTADVVTHMVVPETKASGARFIDTLPADAVGFPNYFVSHRWGGLFCDLVASIQGHFTSVDGESPHTDACVWLDIFAICQHQGQDQQDDLSNLECVVKQAAETLLIVDSTGQVLRRVWCLFEIWKTVTFKGVEGLRVVAKDVDLLMLKGIFMRLDVAQAQATNEQDRERILSDIKAETGIEALNHLIRKALVDSTRSEVTRLAYLKKSQPKHYMAALEKAGQMLTLSGAYSDAEPLVIECLEMSKEMAGTEQHALTITCYNNLAWLLRQQGKLKEAEAQQRRSVELSMLSQDPLVKKKVPTYMGNLAGLMLAGGRLAEAEPMFKEALALCPKGKGDMYTAAILNGLAGLYLDDGKAVDALPLYRRALEAAETVLTTDDPELAVYYGDLGGVLQDIGQYEEAEGLVMKALQLCESKLGHKHPMTQTCMSNLAEMLIQRKQYKRAEPLAREALKLREETLGEDHPSTATALNNLAGMLMQQRKLEEAEPYMARSLESAIKTLGEAHPSTAANMHNFASLLQEQGRGGEAEAMFRRAMQCREAALGVDHPETLSTTSMLATILHNAGKLPEAESLFRRCLEGHKRHYGPLHGITLKTANDLVMVLFHGDKLDEAYALVKATWEATKKALGANSSPAKMLHTLFRSIEKAVFEQKRNARALHLAAAQVTAQQPVAAVPEPPEETVEAGAPEAEQQQGTANTSTGGEEAEAAAREPTPTPPDAALTSSSSLPEPEPASPLPGSNARKATKHKPPKYTPMRKPHPPVSVPPRARPPGSSSDNGRGHVGRSAFGRGSDTGGNSEPNTPTTRVPAVSTSSAAGVTRLVKRTPAGSGVKAAKALGSASRAAKASPRVNVAKPQVSIIGRTVAPTSFQLNTPVSEQPKKHRTPIGGPKHAHAPRASESNSDTGGGWGSLPVSLAIQAIR